MTFLAVRISFAICRFSAATGYGYNKAGANGYLLDDWRVYDAALTAKEVKALKRELNPDPLFIRLR